MMAQPSDDCLARPVGAAAVFMREDRRIESGSMIGFLFYSSPVG